MTNTILLIIIAVPPLVLICLWFSAKVVTTPWQTTAEALVRLLYFIASRFQALGEAVDSGLNIYRDAISRPIKPHCELYREMKEKDAIEAHETRAMMAQMRQVI